MANQIGSVSVNGYAGNPNATAYTIGIGTSLIRSIEPFTGPALPFFVNNGVTILTVIKMQKNGNSTTERTWYSPTATATVITACT